MQSLTRDLQEACGDLHDIDAARMFPIAVHGPWPLTYMYANIHIYHGDRAVWMQDNAVVEL